MTCQVYFTCNFRCILPLLIYIFHPSQRFPRFHGNSCPPAVTRHTIYFRASSIAYIVLSLAQRAAWFVSFCTHGPQCVLPVRDLKYCLPCWSFLLMYFGSEKILLGMWHHSLCELWSWTQLSATCPHFHVTRQMWLYFILESNTPVHARNASKMIFVLLIPHIKRG